MSDLRNPVYVVAGCKPWSAAVLEQLGRENPGQWHLISQKEELTADGIAALSPHYIFFLHWNWKVPPELTRNYECICFHMSDVPYGRGGSPLQNLILQGQSHTRLTALRMTDEMDAGPVYLKADLCLHGTAEEIYLRGTLLAGEMIGRIIREHPEPVPQEGPVVRFHRRTAAESRLPEGASLGAIYDFIRMLDADGYPNAFLEYGGFRFSFRRATRSTDSVEADVRIVPMGSEMR